MMAVISRWNYYPCLLPDEHHYEMAWRIRNKKVVLDCAFSRNKELLLLIWPCHGPKPLGVGKKRKNKKQRAWEFSGISLTKLRREGGYDIPISAAICRGRCCLSGPWAGQIKLPPLRIRQYQSLTTMPWCTRCSSRRLRRRRICLI